MIDKTSRLPIVQSNFITNKKNNILNQPSTNEIKDSFIKGKYDKKLIKSDEQMIGVLSMNSFKYLAKGLINKGFFYNGTDTIKFYLEDKNPTVAIGIMDYETEITEQYHYTPDEFINIIENVKEKAIKRNIEPVNDYEELCTKLIEKLQAYSKTNTSKN